VNGGAYLAIDQGTSATKALVVGDDGTVLTTIEVPVAVRPASGGVVECDPESIWQSVLEAGRRATAAAGSPALQAVALANQGETVLAWDPTTTQPLTPAIVWQDRRAATVCERLRDRAPELRQITGLELDPYFVAPKMRWLRDEISSEGVCGTTDTWILQRLTDAFVTDAATASRTMLLDLDSVTWSDAAFEIFELSAEPRPLIVANDATVGTTRAFGGEVEVRGVCVDQQAALLAEGCRTPGTTKCTYGTGAFLLANTGPRAVRSTAGLVACVAWQRSGEPACYCLDGQVYTVGAAVTWLRQIGLIAHPSDLDRLGAAVPDSDGVTFVPGLAGLAAPFWAPSARGAFCGLALGTAREHLVRAVIEGIAASIAWLARGIESDLGAPLTHLRVDGGLTRSTLLVQLQADLAQVPIEVFPSLHATALGVAMFAGAPIPDLAPTMVVEPAIDAAAADLHLDRWRAAAEATLEL